MDSSVEVELLIHLPVVSIATAEPLESRVISTSGVEEVKERVDKECRNKRVEYEEKEENQSRG